MPGAPSIRILCGQGEDPSDRTSKSSMAIPILDFCITISGSACLLSFLMMIDGEKCLG